MLYFCLALLGIDTATLLASAGILTLIVGLGAQTLVSDILAGLFIIFEGEFQVGDIVTIGDWTGTVVEIGVRTTKIQDGNQNIKVISNSNVSASSTRRETTPSAASIWASSTANRWRRVENILQKEFPNIRKHLPTSSTARSTRAWSRWRTTASPAHRSAVYGGQPRADGPRPQPRDQAHLRQVRHQHPFPQIVVNQPTVSKEASEWEKAQARKFAEDSASLSANIMNEDEDER